MNYHKLDENSPAIKRVDGLNIKLKPHQLTAIYAMNELEETGSIIVDHDRSGQCDLLLKIDTSMAILADKVGSGKSYMILGLILHNLVPKRHDQYMIFNRFIAGSQNYVIKKMYDIETSNTNLIVSPHNITLQWCQFAENSNIKFLKLNSASDFDRFYDIEKIDKEKIETNLLPRSPASLISYKKVSKDNYIKRKINLDKVKKVLKKYQLIILNINRYDLFYPISQYIYWARVIVDEIDSISIPGIFNEEGNFHWYLTATPSFLSRCRFKTYITKVFGSRSEYVDCLIVKNQDDFVEKSITLPKPHVFMITAKLQKMVAMIKDLIPSEVLALINAGNTQEAISKLNCDVDTEENIIHVLTNKITNEKKNLIKKLEYTEGLIFQNPATKQNKIDKIKEKLESCRTRLKTIKDRINSIKDECCFICSDDFDTPTILDCCKHIICLKCLLLSLSTCHDMCPFCRHKIKSSKEYHIIGEKQKQKEKDTKKKIEGLFSDIDKSDILQSLLTHISHNHENPRILIFSDYPQTFQKLLNILGNLKLTYSLICGTPAHIENVINNYNEGKINILMLDSKRYGSGLNLQATDYMILYHRMAKEIETQVVGRAQRFGREHSLKLIYLINNNENYSTDISDEILHLKENNDLKMIVDNPGIINVEHVSKNNRIFVEEADEGEFEEYNEKDYEVNEEIDDEDQEEDQEENDEEESEEEPINVPRKKSSKKQSMEESDEEPINVPKKKSSKKQSMEESDEEQVYIPKKKRTKKQSMEESDEEQVYIPKKKRTKKQIIEEPVNVPKKKRVKKQIVEDSESSEEMLPRPIHRKMKNRY